jgi:hypothetical protein
MELLLNLFWLLLTIPALWLWREGRRLRCEEACGSRHFLLILGCLLILLFPVISASDDLRAMRLEAEDPAVKDVLRHCFIARCSQPAHDGSHPFTLPRAQFIVSVGHPAWRAADVVRAQKAVTDVVFTLVGRAPPLPSRG